MYLIEGLGPDSSSSIPDIALERRICKQTKYRVILFRKLMNTAHSTNNPRIYVKYEITVKVLSYTMYLQICCWFPGFTRWNIWYCLGNSYRIACFRGWGDQVCFLRCLTFCFIPDINSTTCILMQTPTHNPFGGPISKPLLLMITLTETSFRF